MKRNLILLVVLVVLLALLVPAALWAQEEGITLEGLAAQISSLTGTVSGHTERIAAIETAIAPTATTAPTATPTATTATMEAEAPEHIEIFARLLAEDDYDSIGDAKGTRQSFYQLSDEEKERQTAFYVPLLIEAGQRCGVEYREIFLFVDLSASLLEYFGIAAKLETPVGAYWLEWLSTYAFTERCEFAIVDATVRMLDEHSSTATAGPASTPEPMAEEVRSLSRQLVSNDYASSGSDFPGLSQAERDRLTSIYYGYFVYTAKVCDLDYVDTFWLIQRYANMVDGRGRAAWLGRLRDRVPGGGFRLDFIERIAANSAIQSMIESDSCEDYLAWYTR